MEESSLYLVNQKSRRVTESLLPSETLLFGDGADVSYWIGSSIKKIFLLTKMPKIKCMADNKSLFDTQQ